MAKEYKVGEKYYLPVTVYNDGDEGDNSVIEIEFRDGLYGFRNFVRNKPDFLLTAEDIALVINTERDDALAELKTRNAELEALLKEVMATRDEAVRQNDELITENKKLKADCNEWKDTANERLNAVQTLSAERNKVMAGVDELKNTLVDRTNDVQHLTEENDKLKAELDQRNKDFWAMKKDRDELDSIGGKLRAENENLKAWYKEANKTASEAAEANDELKAKIADLRNRVGEQLAQIQDLNAEVHFLKEKGGKPTEEATKHAHVVLNDGTELAFTQKDTIAFYRDDVDMLFISDGDGVIAGFNRGDKPTNFAYFY